MANREHMAEKASHCPACNRDFLVQYYAANGDGAKRSLSIECPDCKAAVEVALTEDTLVYIAKRIDVASDREDRPPSIKQKFVGL